MAGEVGWAGLAASLVLVAIAVALSLRERLRLEREVLVSVARSIVQLLIVGAALGLIVDPGVWIGWSWLWAAGIVLFAARSVARRAPRLPGVFPIALASNGVSAAIGLGVAFGAGMFEVSGRTVVPVSGMLVGNAMKAGVVAAQRLVEATAERRPDIEARLALGLPAAEAARPTVRGVLRTAILPTIENVKGLGIIFLPGAMTGLILAGVDPVQAVLTQAALMYLILGGTVVSTVVTAVLATRRLFTSDHRLRPLARLTTDEG
jgi:putative ABC transport system permease protein